MNKDRLVEILRQLIEVDTTNPPGNEKGIVTYLRSLFQDTLMTELIHDEQRSSLIVEIGSSVKERPTMTFIGHMDTVPYSQENWRYPPLKATESAGRIYGRGSSDMKSGLACMIAVGELLKQEPQRLQVNLRLVFTADEEAGGMGMREIIRQELIGPDELLIVPEPTQLAAAFEEKGAYWLRVEALGRASHGSAPELGSNAIDAIFRFKRMLEEKILVQNTLVGKTTVSLNRIKGGKKVNVTADYATAEIDIRYPPELSAERLQNAVASCIAELAKHGIEIKTEVLNNRLALSNQKGRLREILRNAMKDLDLPYREIGVRYYTDLSSFANMPNEFVILGPGIPDQAHVEDEYLEAEDLVNAFKLYEHIVTKEHPSYGKG